MQKKRIMATLTVVMLLLTVSMTAFAKENYGSDHQVSAKLETYGTAGTRAYTWSIGMDSDRVYLSLTEEYMSTAGNMYTSSPVVKTGSDKVEATYTPAGGRFVSAWSHHGRTKKSFTVYI